MDIQLAFKDFKTEKSYLALQNKYAGFDGRNPPEEAYKEVIKEDFFIYYKTKDLITEEDDYIKYYFKKDYLNYKLPELANNYIDSFKHYIETKLLLDNKKVELYSKIQMKKFIELDDVIEKSDYLFKDTRLLLHSQIEIVINYLKEIHILPDYIIYEKFKMNLNKTDIILLFTLLRQNNIIDAIKDSHLGFLLEKSFLYKSEEGYSPIKNAGKVVNDIKRLNKGTEKAIKRLKELFKNDDFYDLDFQ